MTTTTPLRRTLSAMRVGGVTVRRAFDRSYTLGGDAGPVVSCVTLNEACEILESPVLQGVIG